MSLSKSELLKAYRKMREIRVFEERLHQENTTGDIPGFIHLYCGEEAIAVGVCEHLKDTDYIGSTHRGHGHCIAKGCDIHGMMAEIFGKDSGLCRGKGGSMHIADLSKGMLGANAIVGGAPPLAIGAALTAKTLGNGGVAVSFTGDGGSNQGLVFEAMNMAVVLQLPVIFMFENNGFGEATGHDYAVGGRNITQRAAGFGMPAVKVDGTDFFAVYEAVAVAVERARNGGGPTAIEAVAHRWYGHFEGDPMLYRADGEVERLRQESDPLKIFSEHVSGQISAEELLAIDAEVEALVDDAVAKARAADFPAVESLLTDVYVSY
ncbi:thiamine pyrophosphate-dependent dehydrogenase E1 component subunit alpha [Pseudomonas psychrophila]|uniref:thiamine pyrophosphate-dependent dehydrogenase E1 component subunit alpha n=1 Tax=Pseudomonas psychrophila TaxID=122355 RepID=UPI0002EE7F26|nr:thiamine pyrophosphate-dependent dehydrogenase E1 component subunit alpha [Pseudomonas psychrophila]